MSPSGPAALGPGAQGEAVSGGLMAVGVLTPTRHRQGQWVSEQGHPHISSVSPGTATSLNSYWEGRRAFVRRGNRPRKSTNLPGSHGGRQCQNEVGLTPEASLCAQFLHQPPACQATHPLPAARHLPRPHRCQASSCGPAASLPRPPQSSSPPAQGSLPSALLPRLQGLLGLPGTGQGEAGTKGQMPGLQPLLRRSPTLPRTTSCRTCGARYKTKTCRSLLNTHTTQ